MTFEEWWDAPKTVKQITASTKDIAQQAYAAGRESMRQECVEVCSLESVVLATRDMTRGALQCINIIKELK